MSVSNIRSIFCDVPIIHYAPDENLEHVDIGLIDSAKLEIDMAAYVLTDWAVIQALASAAARGVKVRIYLDAFSQPPLISDAAAHWGRPIRVATIFPRISDFCFPLTSPRIKTTARRVRRIHKILSNSKCCIGGRDRD